MAVIVEQEGTPIYHKVRCDCCNSLLKFLHIDEKQIDNIDGYFGPELIWYVSCPICGSMVMTRATNDSSVVDYRIK